MDAARRELEDAHNHLCFLGSVSEQSRSNGTSCSYTIDRVDFSRVTYTAWSSRLVKVCHEGPSPSLPAREPSMRKCTTLVRARNELGSPYTHRVRCCERSETSTVDVELTASGCHNAILSLIFRRRCINTNPYSYRY